MDLLEITHFVKIVSLAVFRYFPIVIAFCWKCLILGNYSLQHMQFSAPIYPKTALACLNIYVGRSSFLNLLNLYQFLLEACVIWIRRGKLNRGSSLNCQTEELWNDKLVREQKKNPLTGRNFKVL